MDRTELKKELLERARILATDKFDLDELADLELEYASENPILHAEVLFDDLNTYPIEEGVKEAVYEAVEELKRELNADEKELEDLADEVIEELTDEFVEEFKEKVAEELKERVKEALLEELEEEGVESIGFAIGVAHASTPYTYHLTYKVISPYRLEDAGDVKRALEEGGIKPHSWGVHSQTDFWGNYWFVAVNKDNLDKVVEDLDFAVAVYSQFPSSCDWVDYALYGIPCGEVIDLRELEEEENQSLDQFIEKAKKNTPSTRRGRGKGNSPSP